MRAHTPTAPTLDEISRRPELAAQLPASARSALLARVAAVLAALSAVPVVPPAADSSEPDRILDVAEAARRLDVSTGHVYRNASAWPFTVRRGRKLGFSARGLSAWIEDRRGVQAGRLRD
jgi:hypothetical protein